MTLARCKLMQQLYGPSLRGIAVYVHASHRAPDLFA
jgi:hypothetical protein